MFQIPENVQLISRAAAEIGGRAMLVGGCVRDELMGLAPTDWDLEVYGVEPAKLREILDRFGRVDAVGEAFTVYKIGADLDVSLPRRERKTGRGHRGFVIEGDPSMSFESASRRRDFTVNSILKDALTGEIVDCFGGRGDIERRVLKMTSPKTFPEDSLRVLRAAQFAARFEFAIDDQTKEMCRSIDLSDLPKERIWGELEKLLLKAERPSIGLKLFYELRIAEKLFPELDSLVGVPQEPDWHPEGDVDIHTLMVVDEARRLIADLSYAEKVAVMLGAVCHDFGKPLTTEFRDGRIRSLAHDEAGVEPTLTFLDRLGIHTLDGFDVRQQIVQLVRFHLTPGMFFKNPPGDGAFRRLARKVDLDLLYRVAKADSLGRNPDWLPVERRFDAAAQEWFISRVRDLNIEHSAPMPILMGRHLIELGLSPSPLFKHVLDEVYEKQLDGSVADLGTARSLAIEIIGRQA
ncbi:MAG: HD domain-containing protein [Acidobacteria bacterium]|nr:HD domain-containing protein [Acidobacteriota bacterium]